MEFYATGLTRAGVEEVRVGPFASIEEAKAAGERKTKESNGDFVFEAVMDEAGHQVFKVEPLKVANAKFKKGDRVVSVKTGATGVVDEVYGEEKYAVDFGGKYPDNVEGVQIRLANSVIRSTNRVVQNALNVMTKNAAFQISKAKDGNKLNDFIKYSYMDADEKVRSGEIPYVRKDMLRGYIERDVARLKNRLSALEKHLKELDNL